MFFKFPLKYVIKRVQVNQDSLKLNYIHRVIVSADNVNILGRSVHTVRKNTESLVIAVRSLD